MWKKMEYLYILREALVWIVTIFWLYQLLISLCSLIKIKDKPLKVKKDHKFMAIIPAHNEEAVVGNLIESLKNQNYNICNSRQLHRQHSKSSKKSRSNSIWKIWQHQKNKRICIRLVFTTKNPRKCRLWRSMYIWRRQYSRQKLHKKYE